MELSDKARKARNEYQKQYRIKNPDKIKQYNIEYWERKSDPIGGKVKQLNKKSFHGQIPCGRLGKRLVFSRKELTAWMQSQTIRKQSPAEKASKQLKVEAIKKVKILNPA